MKQIIINLSDETAKEMQKFLEDHLANLGVMKQAAQEGIMYEQFIDLYEFAIYKEAEKESKRISDEVAELKKNNISPTDKYSADFSVMSRFTIEFADNNTITFNCEEISDKPDTSQEKIEQTKELFYARLFDTISFFLDPKTKKILAAQTPTR